MQVRGGSGRMLSHWADLGTSGIRLHWVVGDGAVVVRGMAGQAGADFVHNHQLLGRPYHRFMLLEPAVMDAGSLEASR